jgi:hypothetical protein
VANTNTGRAKQEKKKKKSKATTETNMKNTELKFIKLRIKNNSKEKSYTLLKLQ